MSGLREIWYTYYMFARTVVPFGMKKPRYTSSSIRRWGIPRGTMGFQLYLRIQLTRREKKSWTHRSTSFSKHSRYGREGLSSMVGRRCLPTTRSISSWAFLYSCGWRTMARRKVCIEAIVFKGVSVYRINEFSEHSYCILCRWGGVVTRDQLRHEAEEEMKVTSK